VRPVARCQPVTKVVDNTSVCTASGVSVNAGSSDPQGLPLTLTQFPPGPYREGITPVTLRVKNSAGFSSFCTTTVTVTSPDSDKDGVSDCKDRCPGTNVSPSNVDADGCTPLICAFKNDLNAYMTHDNTDKVIGKFRKSTVEVVSCLNPDKYNCKAAGGRCVSLRMGGNSTAPWYAHHRFPPGFLHVGPAMADKCTSSSYCILPGFVWPTQKFTDTKKVTFRAVDVPDRYIHMGASGIGQALLATPSNFVSWSFECNGGQNPVTSTWGVQHKEKACGGGASLV